MRKKFLGLAAFALAAGAAVAPEAKAQRVGPVEDETAVAPNGSPARAEKKKEAAKTDTRPPDKEPAKETPKGEAKKNIAAAKTDLKSESKTDPKPATQQAAASLNPATTPGSQTDKALSDGAKSPQQSPAAAGITSFGSVPVPPKYEPPTPIKADPSSVNSSNPAPNANAVPVAPPPTSLYRVGAGDIIDIRLVGGVGREGTLYTVLSNGTVDYPLAGEPVHAANLTPEEIGARLSAALKRRGIFDRAQFQINVREYVSHTVLVSGLVDQGGQKVLRREAVPLYVVLAEAFPRAEAGRIVIISRATGRTKTLDLADSNALSELVSSGDVINVQSRPREFFYTGGQVGAPGQKDFTSGMTLTQAILASGGLARADKKVRVAVSRQGPDGRLVTTEYELSEIESGKLPDPRIQPGDRIEIGRRR